ncbi:precorrin-3B synthase [Sulfitobacter sp. TSTF-M16]|uniref:Precorrin-3B synthase n=1 Tax=Sulfitobacter aestuariivivens TaxID=2766981 RepID=A0A927HGI6_9RHOB|nr:precorrin-3B synthase [Sulfitobacter aestuariivivens]MBD3665543.1 precorrin-3B synthase [Sulfitobacter aestuariivivens]
MTAPVVKGRCPGALNPMMSGDGLVVRIRPFNGRLRRAQADGIATLATAHGNGMLDISSRGNIQLRGVTDQSHPPLIQGLRHMALVDASADIEARRNVLVTPFWITGDETEVFAADLTEALTAGDAPALPHKFGFAVDTGKEPVLQTASADIRLERDVAGGLILVADGAGSGKPVTSESIITEAMALADWFLENRQDQNRMAALVKTGLPLPPGFIVPRQTQTYVPAPGYTPLGAMVGLALGQLRVETLSSLAKHGGLRMTPWRLLLVENARELPDVEGLIWSADDPLLRVIACTGAPRCPQGHADARGIARHLAPHIPQGQFCHVSGCAKGCAHPKTADITVTGTPDGLSLIRNGRAEDTPQATGLSPQDIIKAI